MSHNLLEDFCYIWAAIEQFMFGRMKSLGVHRFSRRYLTAIWVIPLLNSENTFELTLNFLYTGDYTPHGIKNNIDGHKIGIVTQGYYSICCANYMTKLWNIQIEENNFWTMLSTKQVLKKKAIETLVKCQRFRILNSFSEDHTSSFYTEDGNWFRGMSDCHFVVVLIQF